MGTQEENTVKEVFDTCKKVTKKDISVNVIPRHEGDPAELVADNTKATEILKWKPEKTLGDSINTAYGWKKLLNMELINA